MSSKKKTVSVFDQIKEGLEDSIAFSKGQLSLETTALPEPPPESEPCVIHKLRQDLKMSQAVFAATLNVSTKTIQSWEQGLRKPNNASLRLLQVLFEYPQVVEALFSRTANHRPKVKKRRKASTKKVHA